MDIPTIAQDAYTLLTPALPYLAQAGGSLAEKLKGKVEEAVIAKTEKVWDAFKDKFSSKPSAKEALEDAAKNPKDADAVASLRRQITKMLEEDPALAGKIADLIKTGVTVTTQNTGSIKAGRDISGIASTGTIIINK